MKQNKYKICLATNNQDKVKEITKILDTKKYNIVTLKELGLKIDVPETGKTLKRNAFLKAKAVSELSGLPALSDDTGLFVKALNGKPGVRSSRFAGENVSYNDNVIKLLKVMKNVRPASKRKAYFATVVCFYISKKQYFFREGRVHGHILDTPKGKDGFGYDPVFYYPPFGRTFAELPTKKKNSISHRNVAFQKIKSIITKYTGV